MIERKLLFMAIGLIFAAIPFAVGRVLATRSDWWFSRMWFSVLGSAGALIIILLTIYLLSLV